MNTVDSLKKLYKTMAGKDWPYDPNPTDAEVIDKIAADALGSGGESGGGGSLVVLVHNPMPDASDDQGDYFFNVVSATGEQLTGGIEDLGKSIYIAPYSGDMIAERVISMHFRPSGVQYDFCYDFVVISQPTYETGKSLPVYGQPEEYVTLWRYIKDDNTLIRVKHSS